MGRIEYEDKVYDFDWYSILILFIGAPAIALGIWFSHDWIWLHEISAKLTIWLLNLLTHGVSRVSFDETNFPTPWYIIIINADGQALPSIYFESLCTGVHAIAIFVGVILTIPHSKDMPTSKGIWKRKAKAIAITTIIFYIVNIFRMILQLWLYRNGSNWEDIHYPISSASSFIAVACVLVMHKYVPEFIMSLMWIGDELKVILGGKKTEIVEGSISNHGEVDISNQEIPIIEEDPDNKENFPKEEENQIDNDSLEKGD